MAGEEEISPPLLNQGWLNSDVADISHQHRSQHSHWLGMMEIVVLQYLEGRNLAPPVVNPKEREPAAFHQLWQAWPGIMRAMEVGVNSPAGLQVPHVY